MNGSGGCTTPLSSTPPVTAADAFPLPLVGPSPQVIARIQQLRNRQPVQINYKIYLTENTASIWETVLDGRTLYLRVPSVLNSGSKESFVALLEHAEEQLACARVVLAVGRARVDRAALVRTFMFMGFQPLRPDASILRDARFPLPNVNEHIYLLYNIE